MWTIFGPSGDVYPTIKPVKWKSTSALPMTTPLTESDVRRIVREELAKEPPK